MTFASIPTPLSFRQRWQAKALRSDGSVSLMSSTDNFGEANRQTMTAQVIDLNPQYETGIPHTSAEHAAQAAERYRADKTRQPDKIQTSTSITP